MPPRAPYTYAVYGFLGSLAIRPPIVALKGVDGDVSVIVPLLPIISWLLFRPRSPDMPIIESLFAPIVLLALTMLF